jgi:histone acetyltransferase (RNA polymerase elongator complex component)
MNPPEKPLIIPIFIPHSGCPHQCAFCNQSIITQKSVPLPDPFEIEEVVDRYLKYKGRRENVEIAFFGGNFLGLNPETLISLLDYTKPYILDNKIHGIRFSTRPDTITKETLELIKPYPISAVEIGVQSMNDEVLFTSKRGHESHDTTNAISLLKQLPVKIGVQVMVGLPGDSEDSLMESTKKIAGLSPDFARIYPLMVLKGSMMGKWYTEGRYQPLSLSEAVRLVKEMYGIFRSAGVDVIRMGLQASEMMEDPSMVLAGPWHPAFGHLVFSEILYDTACEKIDKDPGLLNSNALMLMVHPRALPRLRGEKNCNIKKLEIKYPRHEFIIRTDETLSMNEIEIYVYEKMHKGKLI